MTTHATRADARVSAHGKLDARLARLALPLKIAAVAVMLFLVFYNLTNFPLTWYDEGSHLHVPKTLVTEGVYADKSADGYRYYGPTTGVGPTVMLPVALSFKLFGIGLLQARVVMGLYLVATILAFFSLAKLLGGETLAWLATALLVVTRGLPFMEYGREVLGEVPGLFFFLLGVRVWFGGWEKPSWRRLALVGLLFGLAMVTKYQMLLLIAPTLGIAWLANLFYYKQAPQRAFLFTGVIAALVFAVWQGYQVLYLGPSTVAENFNSLMTATSGAAMVFSTRIMWNAIRQLFSHSLYVYLVYPMLVYGLVISLPRSRPDAQRWSILYGFVAFNIAWYAVASIGWARYAFPALVVLALFVGRFFIDISGGMRFSAQEGLAMLNRKQPLRWRRVGQWAVLAFVVAIIAGQAVLLARQILQPPFNAPLAMADYMDANVPMDAPVKTWEPEMGFLTDHHYDFPPQLLLNTAVVYVWRGGAPPASEYDFMQPAPAPYVLVGNFGSWVKLYSEDVLAARYDLVTNIGQYRLFRLK